MPILQRLAQPRLSGKTIVATVREAGRSRHLLVLGPLHRLARSRDPRVQVAVALALGDLQRLEALPLLRELALRKDLRVAGAAIAALGRYPLPAMRRLLVHIATTDAGAQGQRRRAALAALAAHGTVEAKAALQKLAASKTAWAAEAAAAIKQLRACPGCGEPRYLLALRAFLGAAGSVGERAAVVALAKLRKPNLVLPALLQALERPSEQVRLAAIMALGRYDRPLVRDQLLLIAERGRSLAERKTALEALLPRKKDPAVRRLLLRLLAAPGPLRGTALAALAQRGGADITTVVGMVLADRDETGRLRARAAEVLVERRARGIADTLWKYRDDPRSEVSSTALALLKKHFPVELKRRQAALPKAIDRSGLLPLMAVGTGLGASGLWMLSEGSGGQNWAAALSGAALGAASAWLLNLRGELTVEQTGTFTTFAGWGMLSGLSAGLGARLEKELVWTVLAGELLGVGAGMLLMRRAHWDGGDLAYVNMTTVQSVLAGGGLALLLHKDREYSTSERIGRGVVGGLIPAAALTASALTTKRVKLSGNDLALLTGGSLFGLYVGGMTVGMAKNDASATTVGGGLLLGEGLGYIGSLITSQFVELEADQQGWLWMSTYGTSAMLGGLGLFVPSWRGQPARGLALAGAGAGLLLGAVGSQRLSLRQRDFPLGLYGSLYGTALGIGLPALAYNNTDAEHYGGAVLMGAFGGLLAGVLTSRLADVDPRTVQIITTTSLAGASLGAGLGLILRDHDTRRTVALAEGLSLAGLAGGAALASHLRFSPADQGLVSLLGAQGAMAGAFLPALWQQEASGRERIGGVMAGAGAGILAGIAISQAVELRGGDVAELGVWSSGGFALGGGLALLSDRDQRASAALLEGLGALGLTAGALLAPRWEYSGRDTLLTAHLMAGGALHGLLAPYLWREQPTGRHFGGGLLVGASSALFAGMALSQVTDAKPADVGETTLWLAAGDGIGGGIGLLAGLSNSNTVRLLQGSGLAFWLAGALYAPRTHFSPTDMSLTALTTGLGTLIGGVMPLHLQTGSDVEGKQVAGGMAAGTGLGFVIGSVLSQYVELDPGVVPETMLLSADGALFGAGLGLMVSTDDRWAVGLAQGLSLASAVGGAFVANYTHYSHGDRLLATVAVAYGGWQGVGTTFLLGGSDRQVGGAVMAMAGLGGMVGALIGQYLNLTMTEVLTAFSGAVWGSWIGGFGSNLARNHGVDLSVRKLTGITMLSGDVGLLLASLALGPLGKMTAPRMGWINLFGLGGMALATGVGAAFSGEAAQIGTVGGSVVGIATGVIVTGLLDIDGKERARAKQARLLRDRELAGVVERRLPSRGPFSFPKLVADWAPMVQMQPAVDPASGELRAGEMQLVVGVRGRLH